MGSCVWHLVKYLPLDLHLFPLSLLSLSLLSFSSLLPSLSPISSPSLPSELFTELFNKYFDGSTNHGSVEMGVLSSRYVLLKEMNMLLTMKAEYDRLCEVMPSPDRLEKVCIPYILLNISTHQSATEKGFTVVQRSNSYVATTMFHLCSYTRLLIVKVAMVDPCTLSNLVDNMGQDCSVASAQDSTPELADI